MRQSAPVTTCPAISRAQLARLRDENEWLSDNLLKLRVVLATLAAEHGSKKTTAQACIAELKGTGLKISLRSIFRWRRRYLCAGFAGLVRARRSDRGHPRELGREFLLAVIDAAARILRPGDTRREFRRLKPTCSYQTFWRWVRIVQREYRITPIWREAGLGRFV